MSIQLPPDDQKAAESLIAGGRFSTIEEVVSEGIRRLVTTEEIRSQVQLGIEQADRGEVLEHEAVFERLRHLAASHDSKTGKTE